MLNLLKVIKALYINKNVYIKVFKRVKDIYIIFYNTVNDYLIYQTWIIYVNLIGIIFLARSFSLIYLFVYFTYNELSIVFI